MSTIEDSINFENASKTWDLFKNDESAERNTEMHVFCNPMTHAPKLFSTFNLFMKN